MNNTPRYLIYASLVSLALAVLGGLWLVWHTIEEGRALERQNRELQASLEASRIRVENFCEYPSDVLCRVDERSGTVAGALPGNIPGLDELVGTPDKAKETIPAPEVSPSKALENIQKVAKAQSEVETKASEAVKVVAEKPATALAPKPEKPLPEIKEVKVDPVTTPAPAPLTASLEIPAKTSSVGAPLPAKAEDLAKKAEVQAIPQPGAQKERIAKADAEVKPEESKDTAPASPAPAGIAEPEVAPAFTQEFSGKLTDILPQKPVADAAKKKTSPAINKMQEKPSATTNAKEKRMSWSRVEHDGEIFAFTITGAGDSLKANGNLLRSPWRYELELEGLFDVRKHQGISNRLVKSMKVETRNGKTVIVFPLKAKPYKCSLHQIDARTVSVRIR